MKSNETNYNLSDVTELHDIFIKCSVLNKTSAERSLSENSLSFLLAEALDEAEMYLRDILLDTKSLLRSVHTRALFALARRELCTCLFDV